ncbi:FRAS1-related extracellular matrix protein 1 [Taenia crassiceps]|uniref:FRAS1-related extracellular matrix protein 1 n=1 Tax=Taenia crassiceps TaxID=6207 RepID=A0ABR4QB06_9CEST
MMTRLRHPISLLFVLIISTGVLPDPQQDSGSNLGTTSDSFSLLAVNPLLPPARLKVYRGQWAPLLRQHLPITKRVLRGGRHVCRIEVEELAPIFSVVGHLEPKKFDCAFRDGEVRYYHEGNPLLNMDTVRVTIFFFRNNHSIIQTADIPVDVMDLPKKGNEADQAFLRPRIHGPLELHVKSVKATSQAISASVVKIDYNPEEEDCYLSFTRPDIQLSGERRKQSQLESQTGRPLVTPWWEANSGLWVPRLGRPPASGPAIGASRRWPLFGHIIAAAFNRTAVDHFEHECHEALLKGYRYLHRKPDSSETDYVPLQVNIWKKLPNGDREFVTREARYLRVGIAGARKLEPPVISIFRQIFTLTLVAIDPFMQVSEPVNLRLVSRLQPVFTNRLLGSSIGHKPFVFQIFSLPLFSFTGALSIVQKYNLQVVGYIDESMVRFQVLPNREEEEYFKLSNITGTGGGYLQLLGRPLVDRDSTASSPRASWTLNEIAGQQLLYAHPGSLHPTVDRFRLHPTLDLRRAGYQQWMRTTKLRMRRNAGVSKSELELPVRIVRLYENAQESALKKDTEISVHHGAAHCFTSEELITPAALEAVRSDFVDLKFPVKVHPSQGRLVWRSLLLRLSGGNPAQQRRRQTLSSFTRGGADEIDGSGDAGAVDTKRPSLISVISLSDLEAGEICYLSLRRDARTDMIGLQQAGQSTFPTVPVNINILPKPKYQLNCRVDSSQASMEVAESVNFAVLGPTYLRYVVQPTRQWLRSSAHNLVPLMPNATDVLYSIISQPRFVIPSTATPEVSASTMMRQRRDDDAGRLVSLAAMSAAQLEGDMALRPGLTNLLRELEPTGLSHFTQAQIDAKDIVYVPPLRDLGPTDQTVEFHYTVSAPGLTPFNEEKFRLKVLAEDNQKPDIKLLKALEVHRDGELIIDSSVLYLSDEDTYFDRLAIRLTSAPKHGNLFQVMQQMIINATTTNSSIATTAAPPTNRRKIAEGEEIPASLMSAGKLIYEQDGSNVKEDNFNLTATDGHQDSSVLSLKVAIRPRVLLEPVWNLLVNNSIIVEENSTVILHPSVFPPLTLPAMRGPRFFVVVPPTKGKLLLDKKRKSVQFSTSDVANSRISYSHGPAEIGTEEKVDLVRVWDFKTGKIFSLNFTLLPVNSQPPTITALAPLQVKEGSAVVLSHQVIAVRDPDTSDLQIQVKLVTHPKWGHLELRSKNITSIGSAEFAFTAKDLTIGCVFYVNSRHKDGLESVSDTFSLRAYDEKFPSRESTPIHVSIHPVNDEVPIVRLVEYFAVPLNGHRVLTPYLFTVSDRDVPRDILQISFPQLPRFGHLAVHWQHGEQYAITEASAPISESYLGMMNIVYIQNGSVQLPERDSFTVSVSDGLHVVKKSAYVLLRQENRYAPKIWVTEEGGLVLEGLAWRQLTSALTISDADTPGEDLVITVVRAPKLGQLERLQRQDVTGVPAQEDLVEAAMDQYEAEVGGDKRSKRILKEGDWFTRRQLDTGRIYYTYTGEYTPVYVYDSITLSVSDGQFDAGPIDLPIRIRATKGRTNPMVQSQSSLYDLLDKGRSDSDTLLSDAALEHWETKGEKTDNSSILLDNFKVTVAEKVEIAAGERRVLTADEHIRIEPIGMDRTPENVKETLAIAHFQHLESEMSRRRCIRLTRTNSSSNVSLTEFTYKDVVHGQIMLSAEFCFSKSPREGAINLLLSIPLQRPVSFTLPIKIIGEVDNFPRPTVIIGQPISVIPGADAPLTLAHLNLQCTGMDPTKIYFYTSNGRFHWKHDCNVTAKVFSFFNIINDDVVYHHMANATAPRLLLVNLNHLEVVFNAIQMERFIESIIPLTESSPLLQYLHADSPDHITSEPITLRIATDDLYTHVISSGRMFVRAPSPEELTRVRAGEMGFLLTPKHLLALDASTVYSLDKKMQDKRVIIDVKSGEAMNQFTQEDVNRLRLALVVFSHPLQTKVTLFGRQKTRMEAGVDVGLSLFKPGSHGSENITLSIYWAQVGFDRKRYRICASSGVLTLPLVRRGALGHHVEVYVGLDGTSEAENLEVDMLSPKLVVFEADEVVKQVRIRVTLSGELTSERQFFTVTVKAPSGAVLDENSEAHVIMHGRKKCRIAPYFTAFNASSEDEGEDAVGQSRRMSLHDWLASNAIPDSNALNKAYLRSMRRRKRTSAFSCDSSWALFQSRCYRFFSHKNLTWLEARDYCENERGYLASILDASTSNWLKTLLGFYSGPLWIGLHKPVVNGAWLWHSMEQADFTNWQSGYPKSLRGRLQRQSIRHRHRLYRRHPSPFSKTSVKSAVWRSSSTYSHQRLARSALIEPDQWETLDQELGLRRVCVNLDPGSGMVWRNAACMETPRLPFVCMKNPI